MPLYVYICVCMCVCVCMFVDPAASGVCAKTVYPYIHVLYISINYAYISVHIQPMHASLPLSSTVHGYTCAQPVACVMDLNENPCVCLYIPNGSQLLRVDVVIKMHTLILETGLVPWCVCRLKLHIHRDVNDERIERSHLTHSPGKKTGGRERILIPVLGKYLMVKKKKDWMLQWICITFDNWVCLSD